MSDLYLICRTFLLYLEVAVTSYISAVFNVWYNIKCFRIFVVRGEDPDIVADLVPDDPPANANQTKNAIEITLANFQKADVSLLSSQNSSLMNYLLRTKTFLWHVFLSISTPVRSSQSTATNFN